MPKYRFSTIKLVPDLVRDEPINIGVVLHDLGKKIAYHKLTENWAEVNRRTQISDIPDLGNISQSEAVHVDDEYLHKLSHKRFPDSLTITEPRPIASDDAVEDVLSFLFESQISLPLRRSPDDEICTIVDAIVGRIGFPAGSCRAKYTFDNMAEIREFPYAFLKGDAPHTCIFYTSLGDAYSPTDARARLFDIHRIRESPNLNTSFMAFEVQDESQVKQEKSHVGESLALLAKFNIPVVYRDRAEDELRKIRDAVS